MGALLKFEHSKAQKKSPLKGVKPSRRKTNEELRTREFLFEGEVEAVMKAAGKCGRHPQRDKLMILMMFRHGWRVEELARCRWSQIDLDQGRILIKRVKGSIDAAHPLRGDEIRALRKMKRAYPETEYVFVSERKSRLATDTIRRMVARAGEKAGLEFPIHPHMFRHACGYYLANKGWDTRTIQDYLGHASIENTVIYTKLDASRFDSLFEG